MQTFTFYFQSSQQQKKLAAITKQPFFQELVAFFYQRKNQGIILREIKAAFPAIQTLDRFIEELVKLALVTREQKRYTLNFPIFTSADCQEICITYQSKLAKLRQTMTLQAAETLPFLLGEALWQAYFAEENNYFFALFDEEEERGLITKQQLGTEDFAFVSFFPKNQPQLTIPAYFQFLETRNNSQLFSQMECLLGDINPNYFLLQAKRIIRYAQKQRNQPVQPNIFLDALILAKIVDTKKGKLSLKEPLAVPLAESVGFDCLTEESQTEKRVLIKLVCYQTLLKQLKLEHLHYLVIS